MRLLVSWVRDFVDVKASPADIAETLALRGFEVASVEPLGKEDAVIDFEVTANRPDCLSVMGLAREIATTYDLPLRTAPARPGASAAGSPKVAEPVPAPVGQLAGFSVSIKDPELCPRYAAALADVTPTTSPQWLVDRLKAVDVRPISPIVDVTNYVLMELGHPLHAFDRAKLANAELQIRRAVKGEFITTLDNVERKLDPDMLVIADGARPQAVAGVMGGADSEVSAATRTVVFESAWFKPASVRRTGKRLGLKTEASFRFERGADISAPVVALQRALALMHEIGAGRGVGAIADAYPEPRGPRDLALRRARLALLLGMDVPDRDVERILRALGLDVAPRPDGWSVRVPTFRVDLSREVDLIEEVGRHYGFDRLEPAFPPAAAAAPAPDPRMVRDSLIRRVLLSAGVSEAITFGFIESRAAQLFVTEAEAPAMLNLSNPLSAKFGTLRPSLIPGLVDSVAHNRRHGRRDVALFEIGARFTASSGETRGVGVAWTGSPAREHWSGGARSVDFFDVKGLVEHLGRALGVSFRFEPATRPFLVAGQTATVVSEGRAVGIIGLVAPAVAEERGVPRLDKVFVAELSLDLLPASRSEADERVQPLPRFPFVVRDLSLIVADALPAEIIHGTIQAAGARGPAPLVAIEFFDRYKGKGGKGLADAGGKDGDAATVSLAVHLVFQAPDRTLTDSEVQQTVDAILQALVQTHGAVQR